MVINPYKCSKCDWEYAWTMGDRVKAVKRHELAHLTERQFDKYSTSFLMLADLIVREKQQLRRQL